MNKEMLKYVILLQITTIIANLLLITLQPIPRSIVGTLLVLICCGMMYNEGAGLGERACALRYSLERNADKQPDAKVLKDSYNPRHALRSAILCGIVPLTISLLYIGAYFITMNVQGSIYGQNTLEQQKEMQNAPMFTGATDEQETQDETGAAQDPTADGSWMDNATIYMNEDGDLVIDPGMEVEREELSFLDKVVFALRVLTCVLGLPFWSAIAFFQSQYVVLTPLSVIVLVAYPFIWPMMIYLGYLRGPKLWAMTQEAMAKGKRRAKARSRIVRKNKGPREEKPMI